MAQKAYFEQLKDPRWQRRRLEILSRDGFACKLCYDKDKTLHVDHAYYIKGRLPWDYPDWSLVTLCAPCHESKHEDDDKSVHAPWEALVDSLWDGSPDLEEGLLEVAWSADKCKKAGVLLGPIWAALILTLDGLSGDDRRIF